MENMGYNAPLENVDERTGYKPLHLSVVSAACKLRGDDGLVIPSRRHFDSLFWAVHDNIFIHRDGDLEKRRHWIEGFILSNGDFVTRDIAWEVAKAAKQIKRVTGKPGTLYSEDLY